MAASEWIQLFAQPEDGEILRLARIVARNSEAVYCAVVRWFWHVDQKCECARTGVDDSGFHRICRWRNRRGHPTLAEAMRDKHVRWLELAEDGTLIVPNFERYFGRSAKRRALEARRKRSARDADKCPHDRRTKSAPTPTPTPTSKKPPPLSPSKKADAWAQACAAMTKDTLRTDAFRAVWESWDKDRRDRGKKLTPGAISRQIRKLEGLGHDRAIAAIEHSITNGYTGLYEPKGLDPSRSTSARETRPAAPAGKYDEVGITGSAFDLGGDDGKG